MKKLIKWIRRDGLLHLTVSALLVIAISVLLPVWLSALIALLIGIGKEIWDKYHGGACNWHDVICDVAGIAVGLIIVIITKL